MTARPRFARMYMRSAASAEERGATDHRRRLLIERFGFSAQRFQPLIPHILGTARRV